MSRLSPERLKLYIAAQDITDAPRWAIDAAAMRKKLTPAEKTECVTRLRGEHGWTYAKIAKLFGVTMTTARGWLVYSTEEAQAHRRDVREAWLRNNPYRNDQLHRGYHDKIRHGTGAARARADLWRKQDGLCYLCGDPLGPDRPAKIDHDHRCCPYGRSCAACRRGLACNACNSLIGLALDDPDRLERIAANLRTAKTIVTAKLK